MTAREPPPPSTLEPTVLDRLFTAPGGVPYTVHAEIEWDGPIDVRRAAQAASATLATHPLLAASHDERGWSLPSVAAEPRLERATADRSGLGPLRGSAVSRPLGVPGHPSAAARFTVAHGPAGDRLLIVADHRVADGVAIGQAAATFVERYDGDGPGPVDASWEPARRRLLAARPPGPPSAWAPVRAHPRPCRLAPATDRDAVGCGVIHHRLSDPAELALAHRPGPATTNDVFVGAAALAVAAWNRRHGAEPGPVAIGVPINLRPPGTWWRGVCNASLLWPVRVDPTHRDGPLAQVVSQTRAVRLGVYSPAARTLLAALRARSHPPLWAHHLLASCTSVVSHVPDGPAARPSPIRRILGGAPASRSMPVTFAVLPHPEGHTISARYVRARFGAADVHALLHGIDETTEALARGPRRPRATGA